MNPHSGNGNISGELNLTGWAQHHNIRVTILETTGENDQSDIQSKIKQLQPDALVAVGGDGTLNMVAQASSGFGIPIGFIPCGSANAMAREMHLAGTPTEILENLPTYEPKKWDALLINEEHLSLHLSDVGMNARLIRDFERENKRGMWGYLRSLLWHIFHPKFNTIRIFVDDKPKLKAKSTMVVFANGRFYGSGAVINPDGNTHDGLFEICIIKPYRWWMLPMIIIRFFMGTLKKSPLMRIIHTDNAVVRFRQKLQLQVDGELAGRVDQITVKMLPGQFQLLMPPQPV